MSERGLMSQPASSETDLDLVVRPGLKTRDLSTTRQSSAYPTNKKPLHEKEEEKLRSLYMKKAKRYFPRGKNYFPKGKH